MSWEERYQQKDTPWDKGAPTPILLRLLKTNSECFEGGDVLVPGCGYGHDALAIVNAGHAVIGLDISPTALAQAKTLDRDRVVDYQEQDFLTAKVEDYQLVFSVFEHTCFCAITPEERPAYAEACSRLIPVGGYWVAVLFLHPREEDDPTIGPPYQTSTEEVEALFSADFELLESFPPTETFSSRKGKELVQIWKRKKASVPGMT